MMRLPIAQADECVVALVRHGATDNNLAHPPLIQGRGLDPPLSVAGRREANQLADWLAGVELAGVYSSPLLRALETAQALAAPRGTDVVRVEAFTEADVGRWEGRTWEEIRAAEPQDYARFQEDPARWPYAGGESLTQVAERAVPALGEIAARHAGQAIAVIAHNVVNRVLLATGLGIPLSTARRLPQHNGGLSVLRVAGGRLTTLTVNSIAHLDG